MRKLACNHCGATYTAQDDETDFVRDPAQKVCFGDRITQDEAKTLAGFTLEGGAVPIVSVTEG